MQWTRKSGILLHPTSLPGRYGIGDLGNAAYRWIDFLAASRQTLWQVLPLGPTGFADSPYACFSAFAGNPLLIDLEELVQEGDLEPTDLADVPAFPEQQVDYGAVIDFKMALLDKAARHFLNQALADQALADQALADQGAAFEAFSVANASWLDDYALFMAVKEQFEGMIWYDWEADIALRQPEAIARWKERAAERIAVHKVFQFWFHEQWQALKAYANERDIQIIGDVPIFVAGDSADVWANRDLFHLDAQGRPTVVAGVPPDYFSETGQRWGNPLYRWDVMAERGYQWWIARIRATLELVDIVRIDHFRGFVAFWEIPASEPTAVHGRWVSGPGADLFEAIQGTLGELPIMAEDLGVITPEVIELRERFGFPGMKILQFAFDEDALRASFGEQASSEGAKDWRNPFLPHNYTPDFVAYTGSHDNDTALGWYEKATPSQRQMALGYLDCEPDDFNWAMIRQVIASVADTAIVPLQDILGLGSKARMNLPGTVGTNWKWRYTSGALEDQIADRLSALVQLYER
jgi:4-alpha-glucanotransferase